MLSVMSVLSVRSVLSVLSVIFVLAILYSVLYLMFYSLLCALQSCYIKLFSTVFNSPLPHLSGISTASRR